MVSPLTKPSVSPTALNPRWRNEVWSVELVLVSTIDEQLAQGIPTRKAIEEGALLRLRPICMAGLVAVLGFLPMALSKGVGAEVQRPLATVVVGAVIADNLLTLLLLPALAAPIARRALSTPFLRLVSSSQPIVVHWLEAARPCSPITV